MHVCTRSMHTLSILLDLLTKDGIAEWIDKARQRKARLLVYLETFSTCKEVSVGGNVPVDHFYTQEIFIFLLKNSLVLYARQVKAGLLGFFVCLRW